MSGRLKVCGVYLIRCMVNDRCYVGSSVSISDRFDQHRSALRLGKHRAIFQADWNEHGATSFDFFVLEQCQRENLAVREQFYLDELDPTYNGQRKVGVVLTADQITERNASIGRSLKNSKKLKAHHERQRGVKRPDVSTKMKGRRISPEHATKISAAQKGVPCPARTNKGGGRKGKPLSAEGRAKMSASMLGNKNGMGCKHSDEAKARTNAAHLGVKRTDEARARMSRAARAYQAAMREGADAMRVYA